MATTKTNGAATTADGGVDTRKWLKLCKYDAGVWTWVETFTNERALIEYLAGMDAAALIEVNGRRRTVREELDEREAMHKFAANARASAGVRVVHTINVFEDQAGVQFAQCVREAPQCGCRIEGGGTCPQPLRIVYCERHGKPGPKQMDKFGNEDDRAWAWVAESLDEGLRAKVRARAEQLHCHPLTVAVGIMARALRSAGVAPVLSEEDHLLTIAAMAEMGGSFVKALAEAIRRADMDNRRRLIEAFGDIYERYAKDVQLLKSRGAVANG